MAEQYVKKIDGYMIKDEKARTDISTLATNSQNQLTEINAIKIKVNEQTDVINSHTTEINTLKEYKHLQVVYDAENESITFE